MRFAALIDDATAQALGLRWLEAAVTPPGTYGARRFGAHEPFQPGEEAQAQAHAELVMRVAAVLDDAKLDAARDVCRRAPDVLPALARVSMGDDLEDANFLELQRFFDACERLDALTGDAPDVPRAAGAGVRACASALERGRSGKFGFYLDDGFDADLAAKRAAYAAAQAEYEALRGRQTAAVAAYLEREISANEFIVMRDELPGGILPAGVRVVREAPTYMLCEIDADEAAIAAIAKRDESAAGVAIAEARVRAALTAIVRRHAAALDAACDAFAVAECLITGARFARAHGCAAAEIDASAPFEVEQARFPALQEELRKDGRAFTPIDVSLNGVAVLTGPNMGGKSVALRTCGFAAVCAAYGLPVPARRARMPLFAQISWLGIGGDDAQGGLLSAFAREVVRLNDVLATAAKPRFVLMDEFARTTTPREGKALVVAVVRRLQSEGAFGLVATHVDGVASAAGVRHYAVRGLREMPSRANGDLRAALATLADSMDYRLAEVRGDEVTHGDAIALAELLGADQRIVAEAREELRRT